MVSGKEPPSNLELLMGSVGSKIKERLRQDMLNCGEWDPRGSSGWKLKLTVVNALRAFFIDSVKFGSDQAEDREEHQPPVCEVSPDPFPEAAPEHSEPECDETNSRMEENLAPSPARIPTCDDNVVVQVVLIADGFAGLGLKTFTCSERHQLSPESIAEYIRTVLLLPAAPFVCSAHLNVYDNLLQLYCQWSDALPVSSLEALADNRRLLKIKIIGLDLNSSNTELLEKNSKPSHFSFKIANDTQHNRRQSCIASIQTEGDDKKAGAGEVESGLTPAMNRSTCRPRAHSLPSSIAAPVSMNNSVDPLNSVRRTQKANGSDDIAPSVATPFSMRFGESPLFNSQSVNRLDNASSNVGTSTTVTPIPTRNFESPMLNIKSVNRREKSKSNGVTSSTITPIPTKAFDLPMLNIEPVNRPEAARPSIANASTIAAPVPIRKYHLLSGKQPKPPVEQYRSRLKRNTPESDINHENRFASAGEANTDSCDGDLPERIRFPSFQLLLKTARAFEEALLTRNMYLPLNLAEIAAQVGAENPIFSRSADILTEYLNILHASRYAKSIGAGTGIELSALGPRKFTWKTAASCLFNPAPERKLETRQMVRMYAEQYRKWLASAKMPVCLQVHRFEKSNELM
uniref:Uncharacterized protein n=1 Tax=Spongospora subterranea TaxID=70186 RepID=A0A0H5QZZ9_9EUKA|eukprot:CRZ01154.1 hypothetical protein [Spongospora subterranea]